MVRTQIELTEEQAEAIRTRAVREKVSVSEIVRRAVDLLGETQAGPSAEQRRRAREVAGRFSSGRSDIAERHDDYLAEAFRS